MGAVISVIFHSSAEWPPGPPGQVHEGGTAQPGKLLRRDGIRADEGGVAAASTDGIPWLLVCWSWRWIGKFKNPTVGIEENSLSLFFKSFFRVVGVGAIYEVNWGVHEICRSFRYHVDKGSGEQRNGSVVWCFSSHFLGDLPGPVIFASQLGLTANSLRNHLLIFRPSMVLHGQIVSGKHGQQLGGKYYGVAKEQTADWRAWLGLCDVVGKWELVKTPLVYLDIFGVITNLNRCRSILSINCVSQRNSLLFLGGENHSCGFPSVTTSEWFFCITADKLGDLVHRCGHQMVMAVVKGVQPVWFLFGLQGKLVTVIWLIWWGCGKRHIHNFI